MTLSHEENVRELSLHILDIVTNAIEAEANRVIIGIRESQADDTLIIRVRDNGRGMPEELVKKVSDPFVTTRTTRAVGMGISLAKHATLAAKGAFDLKSTLGKGTELWMRFRLNCLNRVPLGDMAETVVNLIIGTPDLHLAYHHRTDKGDFLFDSYWILARMAENNWTLYQTMAPASEYIRQNLVKIDSVG
ncbi:MAG TPA: ATP-binding protein [bacterium]|jgi:anti-sigma regulatory factor (Ser/Thr protein kinase)|nr:ATP-binding protein [bacterium]HNT66042.1 ATP-binding protein [bacterium]HOX85525.1 ATP-binding protein [bacterium]HPG44684.1 ATP-binding protein [bacterium]HPM99409.1 ATP-binding protein [bacterium]